MGKWFSFFLDVLTTPKKFFGAVGAIAILVIFINPGLLRLAVERLLVELDPLLGPVLQLLIIGAGIKVMFSWLSGGGRKKK